MDGNVLPPRLRPAPELEASWRRTRDLLIKHAEVMTDLMLWENLQLLAGLWQQAKGIAFLKLPRAQREDMLAFMRDLT